MIKLIFGWKNCKIETLDVRGQCFFCRMCPSQQFWQGDYLSTSCQNVAISSDPGRVAQMILPDIRSVMTRSQDTRLLFLPANTEALYNLLMSHKVELRWGQRWRSGFRFCWLISFGRRVIVWDRVALRLVNYFEKESLGEVGLRLVIPVWLTGQGREGLTIWSRGGATHLSSARKTWQVTTIVIIITMIANEIINKATKNQGAFQKKQVNRRKTTHVPSNAMWSHIENVWLDCKQISLLDYLQIYLCNLRRCSNHAGLLPVMIFYEAKSIVRALPKQRAGLLCLMMQKRGQAIIRVLCDRVLGPPTLQNREN